MFCHTRHLYGLVKSIQHDSEDMNHSTHDNSRESVNDNNVLGQHNPYVNKKDWNGLACANPLLLVMPEKA